MILAIGDIFDFIRNGMSVKQSSEIDGLPITRIETIWNAEIDLSRVGYAGVQFANAKDYLLKDGDILFSHINSVAHIGKCALYSQSHGELVHGMNLLCFRPNQTKILPKYALYTLRSNQFKDQLARSIKKAVNQASVTIGDIKKIQIEIPPLAEQQRIAEILDKAELVKRKRHLAIERLDELIQSVFLEIFDDPITNKNQFQIKKLHEVGNLDRGVSKHRPRNEPALLNGPYPLIQTGDVANCNGYINQYKSSYSELGLQQSKLWPVGTLCITIAANIAKTGILGIEACFPDSIVGFTAADKATVEYVRIWLSFMQKRLEDSAPESAQKNINLAILRDLSIPVPPIELQKKFLKVVNSIQHHKSIQINSLKKINSINLSIQNQAFSGQL